MSRIDKLAEHAIEKRQQRVPVDQASKTGSDDIKRKATNREEDTPARIKEHGKVNVP